MGGNLADGEICTRTNRPPFLYALWQARRAKRGGSRRADRAILFRKMSLPQRRLCASENRRLLLAVSPSRQAMTSSSPGMRPRPEPGAPGTQMPAASSKTYESSPVVAFHQHMPTPLAEVSARYGIAAASGKDRKTDTTASQSLRREPSGRRVASTPRRGHQPPTRAKPQRFAGRAVGIHSRHSASLIDPRSPPA